MTSEVRLFENPEFGSVRTVVIDNEPWFVGKDVADILGYRNLNEAITDHVEEEDKLNSKTLSSFELNLGQRGGWIINESGLYSLILSSKLPKAKEFKRWVTSEVLPDIRKHGMYMTKQVMDNLVNDPRNFIQLLTAYADAKDKIKEQEETIAIMEPKAEYHDDVLDAEGVLTTTVIAKEYGWSPQKMNKHLHNKGIQYKVGKTWVLYDKYADKGYMETKTFIDEKNVSHVTSYWTQAGRKFIYEVLKAEGILPREPKKKAYFGKPLKEHEEILESM